jgi:tetratricopeptide (TPR) repeat protein
MLVGASTATTVPGERSSVAGYQAATAAARGRLADADKSSEVAAALNQEARLPAFALGSALDVVVRTAWYRGDRTTASRKLDDALKAIPLSSMPPADRPFKSLFDAQVSVGRIDAAKATLADYLKAINSVSAVPDTNTLTHMEGSIALAEKKFDVAAAKFRQRTVDMDFNCLSACELPLLAQAYDQGGKSDSAIAVYERYLADKQRGRLFVDATNFGPSLKRLGELYEAKGDRENAAKRYAQFVDLWKNADPELQPSVKDVQSRLARLRTAEPRLQVTPSGGAMPDKAKKTP